MGKYDVQDCILKEGKSVKNKRRSQQGKGKDIYI